MRRRRTIAWLLLACLGPAVGSATVEATAGGEERAREVRRVLTLLGAAGEEYREGVVDGEIVAPVEYEEARLFLDEAEGRLRDVLPAGAADLGGSFTAVRKAIARRAPLDEVGGGIERITAAVSAATGVRDEIFPAEPPSAARGRALFAENCVSCHGERADGRGPDAAGLARPPANFTDPAFMRGETPYDFFHVITVGRRKSSMPAWGDVFSVQERWDLVSYLWSIAPGEGRIAEGQGIYLTSCAGCHGATGNAAGPDSAILLKPAARFDDTVRLARKTDAEIYAAVADGRPGTPMPAFSGKLDESGIWAAVAYARHLSLGAGAFAAAPDEPADAVARRFAGLLRLLAAEVQNAGGDPGARAAILVLVEQVERQGGRVANALAAEDQAAGEALGDRLARLSAAVRRAAPPAEAAALARDIARTVDDRLAAKEESVAAAGTDRLDEVRRMLDAALAAYRAGDARAVYLVSDAYFQFEPLEKQITLAAPEITRRVESRFIELRGLLGRPGEADAAAALVAAIGADLDAARRALEPHANPYTLAFQSATIILREGFEVILILGALLAYVVKSGNPQMKRPIWWGALAGVATSLVAAYVIGHFLAATGAAVEVLEGATMLLAAAVLFFVSYWLISKAEADKWQRYIQGKVKTALARGSAWALGGAAFLAVFREGVETVLFYEALLGTAKGAEGMIAAGFAAGAAALGFVYLLFIRFGMGIPIRPFFFGTSVLLYYLSFVFAGRGIAELQEGGVISTTPAAGVPQIDLLGIHPTVEGLLVQGVLLACLLYAVAVTAGRSRRERAKVEAALAAER